MMIYLHEMVWHSICQNNLNLYQRNLFRWITPMLDTKWGKYTSCFSQILDVLFPLFIPLDQSKKVSSWTPWGASIKTFIQLNKYETTPYFFLLNQNLSCDCLLICVLPCFYLNIPDLKQKMFCFDVQNKNGVKHRNQQTKTYKVLIYFWFDSKNMEPSHIYKLYDMY